jgi:hypothetical protein
MVADLVRICVSSWPFIDFRLVVLSLTMHAKWCIVVRRIVAMSHCRSVQTEGLAYKPSDRVTSKQHAARQRAVWHVVASDKGKVRQGAVWRFVVL